MTFDYRGFQLYAECRRPLRYWTLGISFEISRYPFFYIGLGPLTFTIGYD